MSLPAPFAPNAPSPGARPLPVHLLGAYLGAAHAFSLGDWVAVREACERVLADSPAHPQTLRLLAAAHQRQDDWTGALALLLRAVDAEPAPADLLNDLGCCLQRLERYEEACGYFERALRRVPGDVGTLGNHGAVLGAMGRHQEALQVLRQALALEPARLSTLLNLANLLRRMQRPAEGLALCDRLVTLAPLHEDGWIVRACCLRALGRHAEALDDLDRAAAIAPDRAEIHRDKAYALIEMGRWEEGWPLTEWRWRVPETRRLTRSWSRPQWRGEPLAGQTILLHNDQGLGDAIMLARLASRVAAQGARVLLEVQDALAGLLSQVEGVVQVVRQGAVLPPHDLHCPLFSLPGLLGLGLSSVRGAAYLHAEAARVETWRGRLRPARLPRIGIAWSGNPGHHNDACRSIPLAQFAGALPCHAVEVINLQTSLGDADAPELASRAWIRTLDGRTDFRDTAALCALVDLVVAVDTSVAHLAGALGRPTWLLLSEPAEYRWLAVGGDTVWYDSMVLMRQRPGEGWGGLLSSVRKRLEAWAAAR